MVSLFHFSFACLFSSFVSPMFDFRFQSSKMERSIFFAFLSLSLFNDCNFLFHVHASKHEKAVYKLIHRHSPELKNIPGTSLGPPNSTRERIRQLMHSDNARLRTILQRVIPRRKNSQVEMMRSSNMMELPMRSAADLGTGQYFVSFRIGKPARKFIMIVDTGSSLTWMKCKYKCKNCFNERLANHERIFRASASRTFCPIPCSSSVCKQDLSGSFAVKHCPEPMAPCVYDYRYSDGTRTIGIFGNDTALVRLTNGKKLKVPEVMIGCSETIYGNFHDIDGVMGLGYDSHSFAVKAAQRFGHKFSYCLVDHLSPSDLVNFLIFGQVNKHGPNGPKLQYTELILGIVNPFYAVNVSGISVDGKILDINPEVWDLNCGGGVIIDSGSSLTQLVKPAFDKVIEAFKVPLSRFKKRSIGVGEGEPDVCFDDKGFEELMMPRLVIHFANGATLMPPVKSYVIDAGPDVRCMGFSSTPWPGPSVIGNILQQNHLWEFDLINSKLGFTPSSCAFD